MSYLKKPILTRPFTLTAMSPIDIHRHTPKKNVVVEGNEHLLAIVDKFARHVDAISLADLTAKN